MRFNLFESSVLWIRQVSIPASALPASVAPSVQPIAVASAKGKSAKQAAALERLYSE